jgi:spore germination protein
MPVTLNSFFQTADDYYNRNIVATFARIIRYIAAFLALSLPSLYLAAINYHPELLPTPLVITFASARADVPFPAVAEVILMELAFELLREAGVRVPGPMGSTIGIVGGLIIGQAAVSAGIVSPVIVIVVSITALSSFAITNEELSSSLRLLKYFMILLAYFFGMVGVVAGWIIILSHLAGLKSFGFPYLMPYVSDEINDNKDFKDSVWKAPQKRIKERFIFARQNGRKKSK